MNIEILKPVIERGYSELCLDIQELVIERIQTQGADLVARYINNNRSYVEGYCNHHNIDLVEVLTGDKEDQDILGLKLVENEIMTLLANKSKYDTELKKLNISTKRITNGIENAPYLALFGSPKDLKWFSRRTDEFIASIDPNHKWYDYIIQVISKIKDIWVDPQDVKPNLPHYQDLMSLEVKEPIKDLIVKPSGN